MSSSEDLERDCYWPNGDIADKDYPCYPTENVSFCCRYGHTCLSNGLCYDGHRNVRGGCTDKTWSSGACPPVCRNDRPESWSILSDCGNDQWCCSHINDTEACCGMPDRGHFSLGPGAVVTVMPESPPTISTTSFIPTGPSTSSSVASGAAMNTHATGPEISPPANPSKTNTLAIGLGAGLGGGAVICFLLLFVAFRIYKKKKSRIAGGSSPNMPPRHTELDDSALRELDGACPPSELHSCALAELYSPPDPGAKEVAAASKDWHGPGPFAELDGAETTRMTGNLVIVERESIMNQGLDVK
ncbi:hypothetical protein QBC37DRAFT_390727 [Rhypophila decipiens]|uniref:Uncharacterized protein n=1 Tax=Rhypophila decipiens TaxID=261697 RepID=A0AAN6Y2G2_9PEZI|nr:hypothetical protein QBC37DRAFT_390727 [Rhypophila decipiens]